MACSVFLGEKFGMISEITDYYAFMLVYPDIALVLIGDIRRRKECP